MSILHRTGKMLMRAPVLFYRYMISPFLPVACRHLPSCSQYASDAIELNGPWKGGWLTLSRLLRCHPWGSQGLDPAPDLRDEHQPFYASWRYGRWTGAHITQKFPETTGQGKEDGDCRGDHDCHH